MGKLYGGTATKTTTPQAAVSGIPSSQLKTSEGLLRVAERTGYKDKAQKLIQETESPKKIFSGGFVQDIFDSLNALQHGVSGLVQGKGFLRGVSERSSFTDLDAAGRFGIPGIVAGIALDIATDPLTYLGGAGVLTKVKRAVAATKAFQETKRVVQTSRVGEFLGSKFIYRFGQDPVYKALDLQREKNIGIAIRNIGEISKPLRQIDPKIRNLLTKKNELGQTIRKSAEEVAETLKTMEPKLRSAVAKSYEQMANIIDDLTRQYVKLKLLPPDVQRNVGQYLRNQFTKYATKGKPVTGTKPIRVDVHQFKARKDIPEEVREQLGQIFDAGYLLPDTAIRMVRTVENTKLFNAVNARFASEVAAPGLMKLPATRGLGALSEKYVPKPIADALNEITRKKSGAEEALGVVVSAFKFGKVVMNPATHVRNILSNFILNDFAGMSLANPKTYAAYVEAAKELATRGRWYKEALDQGLGISTFASNEIRALLRISQGGVVGRYRAISGKFFETLSDLYQKEEEFAKLAQYIFQRRGGLSPEDAWKIAESATFNYAQVTPFIRRLRESVFGFPFITFAYKATPVVVRTAVTHPTRISNIGKIKTAIENLSSERERKEERAVEPDYIRNGLFVRMPVKDKYGRPLYFDLTYVVPFGDVVTGSIFDEREPAENLLARGVRQLPFMNIAYELFNNKDFYGNPIVKPTSVEPWNQGGDIMAYLLKSYGPPLITDFPFRIQRSVQFQADVASGKRRALDSSIRTVPQELARGLAGLKVTPFLVEQEKKKRELELRRRLEELLVGAGVLKEFKNVYIPRK